MKIYVNPLSGCSRRVMAFAAVHEVPVDLSIVNLAAGEHKSPDYLAIHPGGRVPALVDGDMTLWESMAILEYLGREHAPDSLGSSPKQRALVTQWSAWTLDHGNRAVALLNREAGLKRLFGQTPDPDVVASCVSALDEEMSFASRSMQGDFLAGDTPTLADFMLAGGLESAMVLSGYDLEASPMGAWYKRMTSLPGWPALPVLPGRPSA